MSQLSLFEGPHIPCTAAREALRRGELGEARAQLGLLGDDGPEAVDAVRIERVLSGLSAGHENSVASVHVQKKRLWWDSLKRIHSLRGHNRL